MKALVTGSTGFIGGWLCRELVRQGWQVRAFRRESSLLVMLRELEVEHAIGDLTQPETLQTAMQGVDAVFHAAAVLGSAPMKKRLDVTVQGTRNVMEAARSAGVERLVHISSVAALGTPDILTRGNQPILMDETHTWTGQDTHWGYAYSKYLAEMEVQRAVSLGLDAVIVNPSIVFGPDDPYRQSASVLFRINRKQIPVTTEGGLNLVHVADVVSGILAAYERGQTGERYLLANHNMTLTRFLRLSAGICGVPAPSLVVPPGVLRSFSGIISMLHRFLDLPVDPEIIDQAGRFFYYSNQKAVSQLGWQPKYGAEDTIRETVNWIKSIAL